MNYYASKRVLLIVAVAINVTIFILLSLLHFYWAFGGRLWYDAVLPTTSNGLHKLNPSPTAGIIVGLGLLVFSLITVGSAGHFKLFKRIYFRYATLFIAIIFLLRAIGDFRFIGFFKLVKSTRFGINDTQIFSPLCLFISLLSVAIFFLSKKNDQQPLTSVD